MDAACVRRLEAASPGSEPVGMLNGIAIRLRDAPYYLLIRMRVNDHFN
jgi:hypothetical protein